MISGGQPRFTVDFINLMAQLKGFSSADLYFTFWASDWARTEQIAKDKIEKTLLPNYKLAKVQIVEPYSYSLPTHSLMHGPAQPENVRWWYERRIGMWRSLALAYKLIDQEYDIIIRFRPDGMLTSNLDISTLDISNQELIIPKNGCGYSKWPINDQFAIGTHKSFLFYQGIVDNFNSLIEEVDPNWEYNGHSWASEYIMGLYLNKIGQKYSLGNFDHVLTTQGRSRYTDKHHHLPITRDITE